jgi:mono/diheme cytochrome c family protein
MIALKQTGLLASVVLAGLTLAGCSGPQRDPPFQLWPDMKFQPKFRAQLATDLFADHRESRAAPAGAIARGHMQDDTPFFTGMEGKLYVGKMPVPVTEELLTEGQWRFTTYCTPCHDRTGLGKGMVPLRWPAWQPQNLMDDRIVQMADGDIFNVITYGRRTMPSYAVQNRPGERWAIIAYVRVLQRAAHGTINDVPDAERASLEYKGPPPAPPTPPGQAAPGQAAPAAPAQGNPKP